MATIDAKGRFKAIAGGQTTITAAYKAPRGGMVAKVDGQPVAVSLNCP